MKLFKGMNQSGEFTELVKIENFTTVEDCVKILSKHFLDIDEHDEDFDEDDMFYTDDENDKNYTYCQIADDGQVHFVENLDEFSDGYDTEDEWDVDYFTSVK
jgi:hypothetical protein